MSYSKDNIKKAFWEEFHLSGEQWFDYLGDDETNESCTNTYWNGFIETLDKISTEETSKDQLFLEQNPR